MRRTRLVLTVPRRAVGDVYSAISDFASYPRHSDAVRTVVVSDDDGQTCTSAWEVNFRRGVLQWTERDRFDPIEHRIEFRQITGDMASFDGNWACAQTGRDVTVVFEAGVDLGMPALADALEPIAVRGLVSNIVSVVTGLLGDDVHVTELSDQPADLAHRGSSPTRSST
ncbi:MAG: SRPBCC family protein [Ilumatobacteraceae bacterium]